MPKITRITPILPKEKKKLRVAAYARVSMETELLHRSLSAQVSYYSSLIQNNPEWSFAGIYADEGITGTSTVHRNEFNRLIKDCNHGKIDMVLVKSISRFARDTVDCLNTTRHLKELGVTVYFEREKINSMSDDGELLMTLLASFAQEESRSISENVKWAVRKRFEQGIPNGHKAPYGYRWDGEMYRIIPEQGRIVQEIYKRYLAGESAYGIAKDLADRGITGQMGCPIEQTTVKDILSNISYTGTMLLQKNYFTESKVRKTNKGELPMYLVDEMFEPLVLEEEYEEAKEIRQQRADMMPNKNPVLTPFSGLVKCGNCGCGYSRRTADRRKRWVCNTKERKGSDICNSRPIDESELYEAAVEVIGENVPEMKKFVKRIIINGDYVEFLLLNGHKQAAQRKYNGKRGKNPFTCKVWCGVCGAKCERNNWGKKGRKVWHCSKARKECGLRRIDAPELIQAAESLLGDNYEGKVVETLERIALFNDKVEFIDKDGKVKTWQRK